MHDKPITGYAHSRNLVLTGSLVLKVKKRRIRLYSRRYAKDLRPIVPPGLQTFWEEVAKQAEKEKEMQSASQLGSMLQELGLAPASTKPTKPKRGRGKPLRRVPSRDGIAAAVQGSVTEPKADQPEQDQPNGTCGANATADNRALPSGAMGSNCGREAPNSAQPGGNEGAGPVANATGPAGGGPPESPNDRPVNLTPDPRTGQPPVEQTSPPDWERKPVVRASPSVVITPMPQSRTCYVCRGRHVKLTTIGRRMCWITCPTCHGQSPQNGKQASQARQQFVANSQDEKNIVQSV